MTDDEFMQEHYAETTKYFIKNLNKNEAKDIAGMELENYYLYKIIKNGVIFPCECNDDECWVTIPGDSSKTEAEKTVYFHNY